MFATLSNDATALPGMKYMHLWGKLSRSSFAARKLAHSFVGVEGNWFQKGKRQCTDEGSLYGGIGK